MVSSSPPGGQREFARRGLFALGAATAGVVPAEVGAEDAPGRERSASGPIWTGAFDSTLVYGHTERHSVKRGERLNIMLALSPGRLPVRVKVVFNRVGAYQWGRKAVWTSDTLTLTERPVQSTAAAVGTGWTPSLSVETGGWPEGCYSVDVIVEGAAEPEYNVLQTIVRPLRAGGALLMKLSTNTWQAYNPWGGHSLYDLEGDDSRRGVIVSFDRPTPPSLFEYEAWLVRWLEAFAERGGHRLDYASNFDVHDEPGLLNDYKLVVCGSHDEYWSKDEFDAFEHRVFARGGNTIFCGANTGYFQVRYTDIDNAPGAPPRGRQIVCHKSMDDPVTRRAGPQEPILLATARFRDAARRPETMLMGSGYQSWFSPTANGSPRYAYRVARDDLPFFQGTGLATGDVIADVVGYEWDNRDPARDNTRLFRPGVSRIAALPSERIMVLLTGTPVAFDGKEGLAEAVYFRSPAGGKVFNAGSVRWAWGFGRPGFETEAFRVFNANLFTDFLN